MEDKAGLLEQVIVQAQQLSSEDRLRLIQRVAETLITSMRVTTPRHLVYGQFRGQEMSTEKDFFIAEWRPMV
jgi:hypothetical protein